MSEGLKIKVTKGEETSAAEREQALLDEDAKKKALAEEKRLAAEGKSEEEKAKAAEEARIAEAKRIAESGTEDEKEKARLAADAAEAAKPLEFTDENVLLHINKQTNNSFSSVEEMLKKSEPQKIELSEPVEAFREYHEKTGRSIVDMAKLNKDYTKMSPDDVLRGYYTEQNPTLNATEIDYLLNKDFGFDAEEDEAPVIQDKQIAKKVKTAEATKFFEDGREQYKGVLESTTPIVPEDQREAFTQWQTQQSSAGEQQELQQKQSQHFMKSTNELFSNDFKGFEYEVGDGKNVQYNVEDVDKVKTAQLDTGNYIKKHLDDNGMLKDPNAFHKSMFAANDPDGFAKFFYELGASNAIKGDVVDSKNIDMKPNNSNEEIKKTGVKAVDHSIKGSNGSGLTITLPKQT